MSKEIVMSISEIINNVYLSNTFLAIISSISITILAIVIPLSIDVISRLANRYSSDIIAERFYEEFENKGLKYICFVLIVMSILISIELITINFIIFATLLLSFILLIFLFMYFSKLRKYMIGSSYIYNQILVEIDSIIEIIKSDKDLPSRNNFYKYSRGIGDIIVHEGEKKQIDIVRKYLLEFKKRVVEILSLEGEHLNRSIEFLLKKEIMENYEQQGDKALGIINFMPRKAFHYLRVMIYQFIKVHEKFKIENKEISELSIKVLIEIIENISHKEDRGFFIEVILRELILNTLGDNIKNNIRTNYLICSRWYEKYLNNIDNTSYSYIDLFNNYYKKGLSIVIKEGEKNLFEVIISSWVDGMHIYSQNSYFATNLTTELIKHNREFYNENKEKIEKLKEDLESDRAKLLTNEDFIKWLEKADNFKSFIKKGIFQNSSLSEKEKDDIKEEFKKIDEAIFKNCQSNLKLNTIYMLSCYSGAYALYKGKLNFIKIMWNYKQPSDAEASFSGHNIIPRKIKKIFDLIIDNRIFRDRFAFHEGHSELKPYMKKYFGLLIINLIINSDLRADKINFLKNYDINDLKRLKFKLERIKEEIDQEVIENSFKKSIYGVYNAAEKNDEIVDKLEVFLDESITMIENLLKKLEIELELDKSGLDILKEKIYEKCYENSDHIKNFFKTNSLIKYENAKEVKNQLEFEMKSLRKFFIKEWGNNIKENSEMVSRQIGEGYKRIFSQHVSKTFFDSKVKEEKEVEEDQLGIEMAKSINKIYDINIDDLVVFIFGRLPIRVNRDKSEVEFMLSEPGSSKGSINIFEKKFPLIYLPYVKNQRVLITKINNVSNIILGISNNDFGKNAFNLEIIKNSVNISIFDMASEECLDKYLEYRGLKKEEVDQNIVVFLIKQKLRFQGLNNEEGIRIHLK